MSYVFAKVTSMKDSLDFGKVHSNEELQMLRRLDKYYQKENHKKKRSSIKELREAMPNVGR